MNKNNYEKKINELIQKELDYIFPLLNKKDKNFLKNIVRNYIFLLVNKFFYKNYELALKELELNNNRDIKSIILLFFPYLNISDDYALCKELKQLIDLITTKVDTYTSNNLDKNLYKYSTLVFDVGFVKNEQFVEYNNSFIIYEMFINNFYLLCNSLNSMYYKLYANWVNIFPISFKYYENSYLYKNTYKFDYEKKKFFDNNNKELDWLEKHLSDKYKVPEFSNNIIEYSGLPIEEVYNTFINYYYKYSKKFSYLIKNNENNKPLIINLKTNLFDENFFDYINKKKNWEFFTENHKNQANRRWQFTLNEISNDDIIKDLINNFNKYYDNISEIKDYKKSNEINEMKKNFLGNDNLKYLYDFLLKSISDFKNTPYYFYFFDEDGKVKETYQKKYGFFYHTFNFFENGKNKDNFNTSFKLRKETNLTCWQIFQFSKKIAEDYSKDSWNSNNEENKFNFVEMITTFDKKQANNYLKTECFNIVFLTLARLGILSEFKFNPELTDTKNHINGSDLNIITKKLQNNMKKQFKNYNFSDNQVIEEGIKNFEDYYDENYYYVNNTMYKNLSYNNFKDKSYFDVLPTGIMKWYTTHTFNWITQLDFYNKFLNKRVLLITGGTGQGKSTFFPMLVFYGIKVFDYNLFGKIAITQPRISPVTGNSGYISIQLYTPINDNLSNSDKNETPYRTLNGSVQYSTSKEEHVNLLNNYYLKLCTDGKLLSQLTNNFLLKKKQILNKKNNEFKYVEDENDIDIIGIDESHEHNANMDIILTIMKYSLLYNTSIRLLIISATLDDDEPIYRRYYRCIDNNIKYPFNYYNNSNNIDRYFLDRRFHIAPPGGDTRFEIIENYELSEPENWEIATEIGINRTLDIIRSSTNGELLFFTFSAKEAIRIAREINNNTDINVVAIPFYKDMKTKYKDYIQDLEKYKKNIDISKDIILDVYSNKIEEPDSYDKVNYKRIVIIATNIAEASITIHNLKFVVDLGFQITVRYNSITNSSVPDIHPISEASRLQRRGRVGRKESGTVYYIYKFESRKDNKIEYNICNTDISGTIFNLLNNNIYELPFYHNFNPYNLSDIKKTHLYDNQDIQLNYNYFPEFNLFLDQFYDIEGKFIIEDDEYYKFYNINKEFNNNYYFTESGFSINNLLDDYGLFYIIHPNENIIKRDIKKGTILSLKIDKKEILVNDSKAKFEKEYNLNLNVQNLLNKSLLINLNLDVLDYENFKLCKTKEGELLSSISQNFPSFEYDIDYSMLLLYSLKELYDCKDDILKIIAILKNCPSLSEIYEKNGFNYNMKFKQNYEEKDGDIFIILNFINIFLRDFNIKLVSEKTEEDYEEDYNNYKNGTLVDIEKYNIFISAERNLKLNSVLEKKIKRTLEINFNDYENDPKFIDWCKYYIINGKTLIKILEDYKYILLDYEKFEYEENQKEFNFFEKLKILFVEKKENNLIRCLLSTYKHNLVEFKGNNYFSVLKGLYFDNNYLKPNVPENILVHKQYLFYLKTISKSKDENTISYLNNLNKVGDIFEIGFNIYNLKNFISNNSNLINNYDVVFLNKYLNHIKQENSKLKKEIEKYGESNLLILIEKLDMIFNTFNEDNFSLIKEIYIDRKKILSNINFYYYFIKKLLE